MFGHHSSRRRQHHSGRPMSRVKVVHNVAGGPAVNVFLDGQGVLDDVAYKAISDYLRVPSGLHSVAIAAGGKELASATVNLRAGTDYTVIAHGLVADLSSIALLALEDNNSCPALAKAHVRFVHAAAGAPNVDIWANNSAKIFTNVAYGSTGQPAYLPVDMGQLSLSVTPAGSTDVVLGPLPLQLDAGKVYTIIASGLVGDKANPLTALVSVDNMCVTHRPRTGVVTKEQMMYMLL